MMTLNFRRWSGSLSIAQKLIVVLLSLLWGSVHGEPVREVKVYFCGLPNSYVEEHQSKRPVVSYLQNETWENIPSNWGQVSSGHLYDSEAPLRIALALGNGLPVKNIELDVKEDMSSVLILFFPRENFDFSVFTIDISDLNGMEQGATLINLANETLAVNVAGERQVLAPNERWQIDVERGTFIQLKTQIAAEHKERWRLAYRGTYSVNTSLKTLMLIYRKDLDQGAITVTALPLPAL